MAKGRKPRSANSVLERPSHLVIVTHPGHQSLDVFSAHYKADDAKAVYERLKALLGKTGSVVHMVEVPQAEGVVKSEKQSAPAPAAKPVAPAALAPSIETPATQQEFEEQTRQLLKGNGPRDGYRDDKYTGAFS